MLSNSYLQNCHGTARAPWLKKLSRTVPEEIRGRISNKDMPAVNKSKRNYKPTRKDARTKEATSLCVRLQAGSDKGAKQVMC